MLEKEIILKTSGLYFSYANNRVLEDVNICIHRHDVVTITGPNGGGKTTLVKLISGLLKPDKGSIEIKKGLSDAQSTIGYVPQYSISDQQYPITVFDVVKSGCIEYPFLRSSKRVMKKTLEALKEVGLEQLASKSFAELSGGQKQRVLIARAISGNPEILILDEPTASVDAETATQLNTLLNQISRKMTILLVTHDMNFVSGMTTRVLCVNKTVKEHPAESIDPIMGIELSPLKQQIVHHDVNIHHSHHTEGVN